MKKTILLLLVVTICGCSKAQIIEEIVGELNRCNEYSVTYHTTNNCENTNPTNVYLTSEEYQRLYDIVSNASQNCVFVSISPKDGSTIRTGYIKDNYSFIKDTKSGYEGPCY